MRSNHLILPRERQLLVPSRMRRAFTQDGLMTFDAATLDSVGSFFVSELERLDPVINMPLAVVTWQRDITPRVDVTMGDELASFTNSSFASAGGANDISWISKNSNVVGRMQVDIGKTAQPLTLWGQQISYTIPELASAVQTGRPLDSQMLDGLNLKLQMDTDRMVYVGDPNLGAAFTGLLNSAAVTPQNAVTGTWATATPDQILGDINTGCYNAYSASSFAVFPRKILLPPAKLNLLVTRKVSDAGNESILNFVKRNSLAMAKYGVELDIQDCKWNIGAGVSATDRMLIYTNDSQYLRFPLVPIQSTPVERRGIDMLTTYFGRLGVVEVRYPGTIAYVDNI